MSKIIVCYEKHGEHFWDASNDEEWAKSSLAILTERWDYGWPFYEPEKPKGDAPEMTITQEEIDALPDGRAKELLTEEFEKQKARMNKYERVMQSFERELAEYNEIRRIVEEKDLSFNVYKSRKTGTVLRKEPKAWTALKDRSDYEYCRVELETLNRGKVSNEVSEQRV